MYSPYGFHSMSKKYREEALRDVRMRHLQWQLWADHRVPMGQSRVGLLRDGVLSLLHVAGPPS